jgi:hypothetical protein
MQHEESYLLEIIVRENNKINNKGNFSHTKACKIFTDVQHFAIENI